MNKIQFSDFRQQILHRARLYLRHFDIHRKTCAFSSSDEDDALRRIYVINLDRRSDRWNHARQELSRFRDRHGVGLLTITRRFSAIDSRYLNTDPDPAVLRPKYTLADQLAVEPNSSLSIDHSARSRVILMTEQEIAVALSHIAIWKLVAEGDVPSALVLEDDIFLRFGFAGEMDWIWRSICRICQDQSYDILFLSFENVGNYDHLEPASGLHQLMKPGIWEASGYVISRQGAKKLLAALPAYGPIDLWMNLQFQHLKVFAPPRRIIEQRVDEPSTNLYSVLPVLSQVGVLTREKPLLPKAKRLLSPVIAVGEMGSGITALGTALSMLGYTSLCDVDRFPSAEYEALLTGKKGRSFNAYVNVGSLTESALTSIARLYPNARFISTSNSISLPSFGPNRVLKVDSNTKDKWASLSRFLGVEYPTLPYPTSSDVGKRTVLPAKICSTVHSATRLAMDKTPWIIKSQRGLTVKPQEVATAVDTKAKWLAGSKMDKTVWKLRNDTFPSNLVLFTPKNIDEKADGIRLILRSEHTSVREFTSGAIASSTSYLYGNFNVRLKPARGSGLVTGFFLHRNSPRQEIDMEFLGKDTTKMLINVFYNPGSDGTKLEYGYRGTPVLIDLGFDAALQYHDYSIIWKPTEIEWRVDDEVIYQRGLWDPTPIPDQSLQLNINLWHSRSKEFAGKIDLQKIPAHVGLHSIAVNLYEAK